MPAARNNPDGTLAMGRTHYVNQLRAWIQACDIRDETGALAHLTPHQCRHTYATRLNSGVPEEVDRPNTALSTSCVDGRMRTSVHPPLGVCPVADGGLG